jgi:hypothetical protein
MSSCVAATAWSREALPHNSAAAAASADVCPQTSSPGRTKMHPTHRLTFPSASVCIVMRSGRKALLRRKELGTMGSSVLIGILITFLVIVLVLYLVQRLPIEARMRQIVQIIVIIIGIISLLKYLAVF